jgi:hypothetical protein
LEALSGSYKKLHVFPNAIQYSSKIGALSLVDEAELQALIDNARQMVHYAKLKQKWDG